MFTVKQLTKEQWSAMSQDAHFVSFGEKRPYSMERFDYALLLVDKDECPAAWITCHEIDAETVYWQYGGATTDYMKTVHVARGYMNLVQWARSKYKRLCTRIENTNIPMLKLAFSQGFVVTGTRMVDRYLFLELENDLGG